ncbi:hypothetical protein QBC44DRAFT_309438 [Cladorrhinum sp. PSN332]|nr:hypothetical protein QBC44DRAFT_309438 [Cladorrhinum sp. PSN332]
MSLTAASTLSHRAQCVRAASVTGVAASWNSHQQTRGYWFDRDPSGYFRKAYRRYPSVRPRCVEILKQGLPSNKEPAAEESKSYFRSLAFSYWRTSPRESLPGERWASTDSTLRTPDNPTGIRPGQNIEDAERAPLEELLFGTKSEPKPKWQIQKEKAVARKAAKLNKAEVEPEYVYDPVTNRKVPKPPLGESSGHAEQANTSFKSYRSQFSSLHPPTIDDKQAPIFYDGPPPPSELEKYAQVKIDAHPWEANTEPIGEPVLSSSATTLSAPEVVNALESMQKEVLGYQNDIITNGFPPSAASLRTPTGPDAVSSQGSGEFGNKEAQYKPFHSHEPDGIYKAASKQEDSSQELANYNDVRSQEPDGKYVIAEEEGFPEELSKYNAVRSHEPDGKYVISEEEGSPEELSKYNAVRSHEPDGKYKAMEEESSPKELSKYTAVRGHEPDGKYAVPYTDPVPDPAEVDHYSKPYMSHEPDGKYAATYAAPLKDDAELARYRPFRSHEPDGKYAAEVAAEGKDEEMDQYQGGFRSHEPNGKYAAETEQVTEESDLGNHEAYNSEDARAHTMPSEKIVTQNDAELQTYKEVGHGEPVERNPAALWNKDPAIANLLRQPTTEGKTEYRKLVENLMARQATEEESQAAGSGSPSPPSNGHSSVADKVLRRRRLTGQYVQDFPEDFAVAWSTEPSKTKSSLLPTDSSTSSGSDAPRAGHAIPAEALKPALERQNNYNPSSLNAAAEGTSTETPPTMLYKVLVYDPVMQAVDVAETTSMVPDSAAPLTPAEALLRISNPARFFPHFAPLQAQGFEIVSGSGDVLIFRKVRDPIQSPEATVKTAETFTSTKEAPINPIDMTGGSPYNVAAGRFASPTGFVNYELPPEGTSARTRKIATLRAGNMTPEDKVRLEEMVSGAIEINRQREEKEKKKSRLGKRVAVGAFSLAGFMYAVGVAGDSLKQGRFEVKGANQKA